MSDEVERIANAIRQLTALQLLELKRILGRDFPDGTAGVPARPKRPHPPDQRHVAP